MGDFSGGKGGSKDQTSNTTNNTTNIDRRQVVGEGAFGFASDGATINVQSMDAGIVAKALDTVATNDAVAGQSFAGLLGLADKLFTAGGDVLSRTADTTMAQVGALATAQNDAKGAIDQKTMMVLAGVAAVAFIGRRK